MPIPRRGRPPLAKSAKRTTIIGVRFTHNEKKTLTEMARASDCKPAALVRGAVLLTLLVRPFLVGQRVRKVTGDYTYEGVVVACVLKRRGGVRYVVEDDRGLLMIMQESQLQAVKG